MQFSNDLLLLAEEYGVPASELPKITIERDCLTSIPAYLADNEFHHAVLIADKQTDAAAGKQIEKLLGTSALAVSKVLLKGNRHNQVIADEEALVQVLAETPEQADVLVAIGSGTIHDITRFCAQKLKVPFVSVPTAASVDGFTSKGAPLILRGVKQTIQTASPIAVFADLSILCNSPMALTAAGYGDLLAKYTSLLDWEISHLIGHEPYEERAAEMTRKSLERCVANTDAIAAADEAGIRILIEALIESGIVMLLLDFSRPASGAEHHLSHYWEMKLLQEDKPQILHGAKVGIACGIIISCYREWAEKGWEEMLAADSPYQQEFNQHGAYLREKILNLPEPDELYDRLAKTGGPTDTAELGIPNELVEESLNEAFKLRERCTGLYLMNSFKTEPLTLPTPYQEESEIDL